MMLIEPVKKSKCKQQPKSQYAAMGTANMESNSPSRNKVDGAD